MRRIYCTITNKRGAAYAGRRYQGPSPAQHYHAKPLEASISGVEDVENFDDREVVLYTSRGKLTVHGTELHIERLSVDEGDLTIEGRLIPSNTPRKCAAGAVSSPSCSDDHPDRRTNDGAVYPVCLRCARRHIFRYIICCPAVVRQARRRLFMGRVVRYPIPDRRHHVFPDRLQRLPASFSSFLALHRAPL